MRQYKAFISYSHHDAKWAKWLLNALESYKIPGQLTARSGNIPDSLSPIFRDREELPASDSIREEIFEALRMSDNLIVICSPYSATSERVQEEITEFKRLHSGRNILCLIVDGEPGSRSADECFPSPILLDKGEEHYIEPLAADARKGGDGKHNAMLKIAAGILNVKLSALIIRDSARRQKKYALAGIAATAIIGIISALAIEANIARKEAVKQTQNADGLYIERGELKTAHELLIGLFDLSKKLKDKHADNIDYYFASTELYFRLGYIAEIEGKYDTALRYYEKHKEVIVNALKHFPNNAMLMATYGNNYIYQASIYLEHLEKIDIALLKFKQGFEKRKDSIALATNITEELFTRNLHAGAHYHWARGLIVNSKISSAIEILERGQTLSSEIWNNITKTLNSEQVYIESSVWLAEAEVLQKIDTDKLKAFEKIVQEYNTVLSHDPDNIDWIRRSFRAKRLLVNAYISANETKKAKEFIEGLKRNFRGHYKDRSSEPRWDTEFYYFQYYQGLLMNNQEEKLALISDTISRMEKESQTYLSAIDAKNIRSQLLVLYGKTLEAQKQPDTAATQWQKVIDLYDHKIDVIHPRAKSALMEAHMLLGNDARAIEIAHLLWEQEYREAHFMHIIKTLAPTLTINEVENAA